MTEEERIERLKAIVTLGGGEWLGIQEGEGLYTDLILFHSPQTGSTLALRDDEFFTVEAVQNKIQTADKMFGIYGE